MAKGRSNKPAAAQTQSLLATQFASVAAGGYQQTLTAVRGVADNLALATRVALGWDKVQRTITINAAAMAKAFANVGPALAAGVLAPLRSLQSMVNSVAGGTQEAEALDNAMAGLSRTMANELAPYVRLLTTAVQMLTGWWQQLDPAIKRQIALWVAVAAGIAAAAALIPVLVGAVGALVSAFVALYAVISAPFVLVPVLVTAAIAALVTLFGLMVTDSQTASEAMGGNFWAWVDVVFDGIKAMLPVFVKFFNWLSTTWAKIVDRLAEKMVDFMVLIGEWTEEFAEQVRNELKGMGPTVAPQIDMKDAEDALERMRGKFKGFIGGVIDMGKGLGANLGKLLGLLDKVGKGPGFRVKFDVAIETPQATFDRLMKAFAAQPAGPEQQQVDLLKEGIDLLKGMVKDVGKVGDAIPAVRK